jgi:hypothetical protein
MIIPGRVKKYQEMALSYLKIDVSPTFAADRPMKINFRFLSAGDSVRAADRLFP